MTILVVDSREPKKLRDQVEARLKAEGVDVEIRALHSADYSMWDVSGRSIGVERKAIPDFLASIAGHLKSGNQRLGDQLERVAADYDSGILLLEGGWTVDPGGYHVRVGGKKTGWHVASMQMAALSVQTKWGMRVLWTPDQKATVETIRALVERGRIKEL